MILFKKLILLTGTLFSAPVLAASSCVNSVGPSKIITPGQFSVVTMNRNITLDYNRTLKEKFENHGISLESPIYSTLMGEVPHLIKLPDYDSQIEHLATRLKVVPLRAERALLLLDKDLNGVNRDRIFDIKNLAFRSWNLANSPSSLRSRKANEPIHEWVDHQRYDLLVKYENHFNHKVLSELKQPNRRPIVKNTIESLDSAHAINYDIEPHYGFLGPRLIIKGFFRVGFSATAIRGTSSYRDYYHFIRFINQLLRFDGSMTFEEAIFQSDSIYIQLEDKVISLSDFKKLYHDDLYFDKHIHIDRRKRLTKLSQLMQDNFMTIIVPSSIDLSRDGAKFYRTLRLQILRKDEAKIQLSFVEKILKAHPDLLIDQESKNILMSLLKQEVFNPQDIKRGASDILKNFVAPTYQLPILEKLNPVPPISPDIFLRPQYSLFSTLKGGAAEALRGRHQYLMPTKSLNQRLKQLIQLTPSKSSHITLLKLLEKLKLKSVSLNSFTDNFLHTRSTYRFLLAFFKGFNGHIESYNSSLRGDETPIPLIRLTDLLQPRSLDIAISSVERYFYLLSRFIDTDNPIESRLKDIKKLRTKTKSNRKKAIDDLPMLSKKELSIYRGEAKGNFAGVPTYFVDVANSLGVVMFNSGSTQKSMDRLLFRVKKDFSSKTSKARISLLEERLKRINFGKKDMDNSRKYSHIAAQRIFSYLAIIAMFVQEVAPNTNFDPLLMYRSDQIELLMNSIPSMKTLMARKRQETDIWRQALDNKKKIDQDRAKNKTKLLSDSEVDFLLEKDNGIMATFMKLNKYFFNKSSIRSPGSLDKLTEQILIKVEASYPNSQKAIFRAIAKIRKIYPNGHFISDGINARSIKVKYRGARSRVFHLYLALFELLQEVSGERNVDFENSDWFVGRLAE